MSLSYQEKKEIALKVVFDKITRSLYKVSEDKDRIINTILDKIKSFPNIIFYRCIIGIEDNVESYISRSAYKSFKWVGYETDVMYEQIYGKLVSIGTRQHTKYSRILTSKTASLDEKNAAVLEANSLYGGQLRIEPGTLEEFHNGINNVFNVYFQGVIKPLPKLKYNEDLIKQYTDLQTLIKKKNEYINYLVIKSGGFPHLKLDINEIRLYTNNDDDFSCVSCLAQGIKQYFDFSEYLQEVSYIPKWAWKMRKSTLGNYIVRFKVKKFSTLQLKEFYVALLKNFEGRKLTNLLHSIFKKVYKINNKNIEIDLLLIKICNSKHIGTKDIKNKMMIKNVILDNQYQNFSWVQRLLYFKFLGNYHIEKIIKLLDIYIPQKTSDHRVVVLIRGLLSVFGRVKHLKDQKQIILAIFEMLNKNKWFLKKHKIFGSAVREKIIELSKNKKLSDVMKKYKDMF